MRRFYTVVSWIFWYKLLSKNNRWCGVLWILITWDNYTVQVELFNYPQNIKFFIEINELNETTNNSIHWSHYIQISKMRRFYTVVSWMFRDSNDPSFASESRITPKPIQDSKMNSTWFTGDSSAICEWFVSDLWVINQPHPSDSKIHNRTILESIGQALEVTRRIFQ